jgi:hypothetical protein
MKNVTISMDEETLTWVRVEAARAGKSVSRWLADYLGVRKRLSAEKAAASERIERLLASLETPRFALSENGKITIDRDEIYDDGRFSRFDGPAVQPRHQVPDQTRAERQLAEDAHPFKQAGDKPADTE